VGQVLFDLGLEEHIIEGMPADALFRVINKSDDPVEFTPKAEVVARAAQMQQDSGRTWGQAVEWARDHVL